jgi:hypothetical protein
VHAKILSEDGVVWLARFATLRVAAAAAKKQGWANENENSQGGRTNEKRREVTYNVSDIFRKCKTQSGEHALEGVLVLIDAIALRRDSSSTRR